MQDNQLKQLIEASLFVQGKVVSILDLKHTVLAEFDVSLSAIRKLVTSLQQEYQDRGVQLVNVSGGYRFQTREELTPYLQTLWEQKAPKYSRATLETLAVIAYRQPVSRGDIEQVRGVTVSSQIIKNMLDRQWIRILGHKDVPGRPAIYGTTPDFLSYFGLGSLKDLPELTDDDALNKLFLKTETQESS